MVNKIVKGHLTNMGSKSMVERRSRRTGREEKETKRKRERKGKGGQVAEQDGGRRDKEE